MMKKKLLLCLSALLLLLSFPACAEPAADTSAWQAYSGKRIGVQVGTTCGQQVKTKIPDAVLLYYNTQTDLLAALRAGKIDMMASDETLFRFLMMECDDLTILDGYLATFEYAPIFAKTEEGRVLRDQYSAFVDSLWENGTIRELDEIWYGKDEAMRTVLDYESLPDTNGTLYMAVDTSVIPFSYVKDNRVVGYDIDIAARFCREYGYRLEVIPMDFGGLLSAVQSGRVDFAACGITVTEERKESVLFGTHDYKTGSVLAVLSDNPSPITSLSQLSRPGIRIAMKLDTPAEQTLRQDYPEAQLIPYSDNFLSYMDVANGRVDACVHARTEMEYAMQNGLTGVRLLEENYALYKIVVGISPVTPIPDLREKLNRFIAECRADGTLDDMYERWVLRGEQTMPDIPPAENPSFTLRVGTTGSVMPYSYYIGTELAGYDIELAHRFAAWLGVKLEFKVFDFGGIIAAAEAGRIDCIMSNLYYSEERDKSIPFSDVLFEVEITAMVRDEKQDSQSALPGGFAASAAGDRQETFWDGIKSSFDKTFIRENRWKLFADGVLTTLLITVLSILFGTLLGFLVFMLCRNGNIVANGVTRFCIWLVHGMPTVVLLMVLYYIVFGSVAINGIAVAVLGFTLTFGASVFGLLKLGVGTIDRGQYEAAYALGHSNRHTFFRIILPQAIPHILPAYQGEIAGLIKATAIVGYIAVQDLTKMGDIVRSRTYEAFFPLIAITIIYFVLEGLFSLVISRISISINPRKRKRDRILKGVNTHD